MTDLIPVDAMTNLSPAAQAVLDAVFGYIQDEVRLSHCSLDGRRRPSRLSSPHQRC
jgi:hypothetical protein